ncbi:MAG: N-acetylmannosamine-6-phosphate 2-epimerase [Brevefilum sp.]|jgi:N-acylglucosamine-6-phosphate 2-epimerase
MENILESLQNKLIVSCQAFPGSPLYGGDYMQKMAMCAIIGGAAGIRACWPDNVRAIRQITDLPIVGINKALSDTTPTIHDVIITPNFESAAEVIEAGCTILGLDSTPRGRTYDDVAKIIEQIKKYYPDILIMADISTLEEGVMSEQMGVDIVSTTLSGYTAESLKVYQVQVSDTGELLSPENSEKLKKPDIDLVSKLREKIKVKINCEGRYNKIKHVLKAMRAGADMITIGGAITMPEKITGMFVDAIESYFS